MLYKYELHCHTAETSRCAESLAKDIVNEYKRKGYSGIVITDHFVNGNSTVSRKLSWKERMDEFCKGYENALEEGERIGLQVFFGFEWTYQANDFIILGLDKNWLYEHPESEYLDVVEFLDLVHKYNGFVIHAHPFREACYIDRMILVPDKEDAVEVYNTSHIEDIFNQRALAYAKSYNKVMTSGSDCHNVDENPCGGVYFDHRVNDLNEMINLIRENKIDKLSDGKE